LSRLELTTGATDTMACGWRITIRAVMGVRTGLGEL